MNKLTGIISAAVLICALAGPARAELSGATAPGGETPGQASATPVNGGGQAAINSLLDRFAGTGSSDPSSEESNNRTIPIVPTISETSLDSAFTRAGSPMNAYYSRSGSDSKEQITAISRSAAVTAVSGSGEIFMLADSGLAAAIQGHFVGSGVVVDGSIIAPIQIAASDPGLVVQTNANILPGNTPVQTPVPLPLPFLLTGSGLAALLVLRKRVNIPEYASFNISER